MMGGCLATEGEVGVAHLEGVEKGEARGEGCGVGMKGAVNDGGVGVDGEEEGSNSEGGVAPLAVVAVGEGVAGVVADVVIIRVEVGTGLVGESVAPPCVVEGDQGCYREPLALWM